MSETKFQPGRTYSTSSACDHDCIFSVTIAKRTDRTVTTTDGKTFRPGIYNDAEYIKPMGNYSMAPIIRAA